MKFSTEIKQGKISRVSEIPHYLNRFIVIAIDFFPTIHFLYIKMAAFLICRDYSLTVFVAVSVGNALF